jgi:hypothetical protein
MDGWMDGWMDGLVYVVVQKKCKLQGQQDVCVRFSDRKDLKRVTGNGILVLSSRRGGFFLSKNAVTRRHRIARVLLRFVS